MSRAHDHGAYMRRAPDEPCGLQLLESRPDGVAGNTFSFAKFKLAGKHGSYRPASRLNPVHELGGKLVLKKFAMHVSDEHELERPSEHRSPNGLSLTDIAFQ